MDGVVLIGLPGSGKSTIGKILADIMGYTYISTGDIARDMANDDKTTRNNLAAGKMADEHGIRRRLSDVLAECSGTFVLDGFPRFREQFEWLEQRFDSLIYIEVECPINECINRLYSRRRSGETDNVILNRIAYYVNNTIPMLDSIADRHKVGNYCDNIYQTVCETIYNLNKGAIE